MLNLARFCQSTTIGSTLELLAQISELCKEPFGEVVWRNDRLKLKPLIAVSRSENNPLIAVSRFDSNH